MINVGEAFKEGVVAQSRRVKLKAIVDITPTEVVYGVVDGSTQSVNSKSSQIHNKTTDISMRSISSELNKWIIGEPFTTYDRNTSSEIGYETFGQFDENGEGNFFVEAKFTNVNILQACHIYFPNNTTDGYAVDYTIEVKQGNNSAYTKVITDSRTHDLFVSGFTVYYPTSIKLTITKWSLPNRRMRVPELILGMYDEWLDDMFASFNIQQRSSFTAFSLPYTTCEVEIDNSKLTFDPTNKQGMFLSLEERQPIELLVSVNDSQFHQFGTYYHYSGGWKTGNSSLSMRWNLVDLIGLLYERKIDTNGLTLPTKLGGWIAMLVSQLGSAFANLYEVPSEYANLPLSTTADKLKGHTCGEVLQWCCQATQTWPRAVANGKLYVGKFERYGQSDPDLTVKLLYDNLDKYPILKANDDIARFDYKISDNSTVSIAGTSASSPTTQSVDNPFINSNAKAETSAIYALQFYGGNKIETSGRGNPSQEIGDIVYVEMSKGAFQAARVVEQSFQISEHVMKGCKTILLAIDPSAMYSNYVVITEGTEEKPYVWSVPGNLTIDPETGLGHIKVVLVQAGWTGGHGGWRGYFSWDPDGNGEPGPGGNIFIMNDVPVMRGLNLEVVTGLAANPSTRDGEKEALIGGHSTITINGTVFSSHEGETFENGLIEPVSAKMVGRPHRGYPAQNSGDGGGAGREGYVIRHEAEPESQYDYAKETWYEYIYPTQGTKGADGCVIICFNTTEEA